MSLTSLVELITYLKVYRDVNPHQGGPQGALKGAPSGGWRADDEELWQTGDEEKFLLLFSNTLEIPLFIDPLFKTC